MIDNGGRDDEGCIGDLTVLEVRAAGLAGIVVWGRHRDHRQLVDIGLPVFSRGTCPSGPLRLERQETDALESAEVGHVIATGSDYVFADDDGVLFAHKDTVPDALPVAEQIHITERHQAERISSGESLRDQLAFAEFLRARESDPSHTFREHLRSRGGAIEE